MVMKLAGPKSASWFRVMAPWSAAPISLPLREMIVKVRNEVQQMINDGKSLKEVLAAPIDRLAL